MKDIIITAVSFIAVFGTIVLFHELGHFSAAKLFGVRVHEFAVGIGPKLWSKRRGDTQYALRALPLGGFVKLAGMDQALNPEDELAPDDLRNFDQRPIWQRMIIIIAGPFMNFFLAFLLIAGFYMAAFVPPTVTDVSLGLPAERAGIMPGDIIVEVEGIKTDSAQHVIDHIRPRANKETTIVVQRDQQRQTIVVIPRFDSDAGVGMIGIELRSQPRLPATIAIPQAVKDVGRGTMGIIRAIGEMVMGKSEVDLRGPIGIVTVTGEAARMGFGALLTLAIGLNLNLGLLNLFPIPVLDGGWLLLLTLEALRGRPLKPEQRGVAQFIGLMIILALMIYAFYQDVLHLRT